MALSTCIWRDAILPVAISSFSGNCFLPLKKGGIFNLTPMSNKSSISNPLSESPGSSRSSIPLLFVNSLSDMQPGYSEETNVTAPSGEIPTKGIIILVI